MSVNGQSMDLWKKMLLDFDQRAEFWLEEMHSAKQICLFDNEFEKIFLKISTDR